MRIPYAEMKAEFKRVFLKYGLSEEKAELCATIHTQTNRDGIYSHGSNRISLFASYLKKGWVNAEGAPVKEKEFGAIEVYNGNLGPGITNAVFCVDRAIELAKKFGIGLIGLKNTTHWMRAGTYGLRAADQGFIGINWTNVDGAMPPWGGMEGRLGNNPFVMAAPSPDGTPLLLDMAMSLYSYGKLQVTRLAGKKLPFPGGFDKDGNLTDDPKVVEETRRLLPMGYWKGASFAFILDILSAILSDGGATIDIDNAGKGICGRCSQAFIVIDPQKTSSTEHINEIITRSRAYIKTSALAEGHKEIRSPGEGIAAARKENDEKGIFVDDTVWAEIKAL
ncbi:MAG: 3-dehydro-L-gulonate 2-dehydrogenase [Elusimicrobiota bacterium]|jgi:3-dehydro-L-gulonate 2-dehydrogenase|nr:3-dehydro-L-gulonate 2-dehydrogenase [Elusimicrobiota bacterium]